STIFLGDPATRSSATRWGDNLSVRGSGTNTQIIVDTYIGGSGTNGFAAILSPINSTMSSFSSHWFTTANFAATIGRSLEFDLANNSIWQKVADAALYKNLFDPAVSLGGTRISSSTTLASSGFPIGLA